MKKVILILFIFATVLTCAFSQLTQKDANFYIYLNKLGTDQIHFSDTANEDGSIVTTHVFPLITGTEPGTDADDKRTVESTIYLHWIHQSGFDGISIELSFVAKEDDNAKSDAGYMLHKENSGSDVGLNYYVKFHFNGEPEDNDDSNDYLTPISFENKKPESGKVGSDLVQTTKERWRKFSLDEAKYKSPLTITMTIKAPYDVYTTTTTDSEGNTITTDTYRQYWMEAQYGGYIKAVITDEK